MINDYTKLPKCCCYCRSCDDLNLEHVIPKCFSKQVDQNWEPIIVWACKACNSIKSKDDERVRDMLAADIGASNSASAQKLLDGPIARSIVRARDQGYETGLLRAIKEARKEPIFSGGGVILGEAMVSDIDKEILPRWLRYVVRGLTFALSEDFLQDDFEIEIIRKYEAEFLQLRTFIQVNELPDPVAVGSHTKFTYRPVEGYPAGHGIWIFEFFGGVVFVVFVLSKTLLDKTKLKSNE